MLIRRNALLVPLALIKLPITAASEHWAVFGLPEVPPGPEAAPEASAPDGFPAWLRITHYVNFLFLILLVGRFYDSHSLENLMHPQALRAYEMNGEPLATQHGPPLRLRVENQLGFKMVKWNRAIESVESHKAFGEGEGGYNEDHEYSASWPISESEPERPPPGPSPRGIFSTPGMIHPEALP